MLGQRLLIVLALTTAVGVTSPTAVAQGWGHVDGQIILQGNAPVLPALVPVGAPVKDSDLITKDIPDESLIVDPQTNGISNIFVFVREVKTIHPDLAAVPPVDVKLDIKGLRYVPHALCLRAGQPLHITNHDACLHNTHTWNLKNDQENITWRPHDRKGMTVKFANGEILPIKVGCDIHSWISMRLLILDHPYMTITDKDGKFEIKHLPAGTHEIRIWHERAGYLLKQEIEIFPGQTSNFGLLGVKLKDFKLSE